MDMAETYFDSVDFGKLVDGQEDLDDAGKQDLATIQKNLMDDVVAKAKSGLAPAVVPSPLVGGSGYQTVA